MKKKLIIVLIIILIVFGLLLIYRIFNGKTTENTNEETSTIEESSNFEIDNNDLAENNIENNTNMEENNNAGNLLSAEEEDEEMTASENDEEIKINIIVNSNTYTATLYNNETVQELITQFPITLNMSDLNSNEKYSYLDTSFTTNSYKPNQINAGDIKLYGNNCIVVFYKNFKNSLYSYTDLGTIDDVEGFVSELGNGSVTLKFEIR